MSIFDQPHFLTLGEAALLYREARQILGDSVTLVPVKLATGEQTAAVCAVSPVGVAPVFIVATPRIVAEMLGSTGERMLVDAGHFVPNGIPN